MRADRDPFAQHSGIQEPTDSTEDTKRMELIEKERRWVESQILLLQYMAFIFNG